jgi:hypothetical protein
MRQYEMCELVFQASEPKGSFVEIDLIAQINSEQESITAKGFYAGEGTYKVRFLPKYPGIYNYCTKGIINEEGKLEIKKALPGKHGMVKTSDQHFTHEDGTAYHPFGTTVYALTHQNRELIDQTMDTLEKSPFNKVRMCVFPKHYDFNQNEPEFYAFEKDTDGLWDVNKPCMKFWDAMELHMAKLDTLGVQVDLILFHPYDRWGFAALSQKDNLIYLDYLLRRFSALPNIWWSLANEYDLCLKTKTIEDWEEIEEYVAVNDPYHHLLSNHNCFKSWDFHRENITHVSYQTKELAKVPHWYKQYKKPVMIDECCYEGNLRHFWGCISGREMAARFWRVVTSGGYCTHGETFLDDNEIVWWSKGGKLKGESAKRIQFLKEIIYSLPGALEPLPGNFEGLLYASDEEVQENLKRMPPEFAGFVKAIFQMDEVERREFAASEQQWQGHYKEEAFLYYYDLRCCGQDILELPEHSKYKIELIDTWNMTRTTLLEEASGKTEIKLPGKEGMAALVMRKK